MAVKLRSSGSAGHGLTESGLGGAASIGQSACGDKGMERLSIPLCAVAYRDLELEGTWIS